MAMGGADYFDQSNAFVFCKVLLACQKHGEAILFLWRQRKALAAVHLAAVCLHYGLVLPHRPLSYSPGAGPSTSSDPTPAALLRVYIAAPFLLDYPEEAVDYLVSLDSKWQEGVQGVQDRVLASEALQSEAAKTFEFSAILTSVGRSQLTQLVGSLLGSQETTTNRGLFPSRGTGYLDRYLSAHEVNLLLAKAAHFQLTQARDGQGAIYSFMLAGRFEDALEELINQLGLVLLPPAAAPAAVAREHLIQQAKAFKESVLGGRMQLAPRQQHQQQPPPLLQQLAAARPNRLETLSATLDVMLQLCAFVDAWRQTRFRDALAILDAMDFRFDERLQSAFGDLHRVVQLSFDFVLHKAMECVRQLYNEARAGGGVGDDVVYGLRRRASDIARFANNVSALLQPATASTLCRIQVGLV